MPSDFITYTFGKLIEDFRKIVTAGVAGIVNEIVENKLSEIEEIRRRISEIERILKEQKTEQINIEKKIELEEPSSNEMVEIKIQKCQFEGCDKEVVSRGYCKNHYYQLKRKGLLKKVDKNKSKRLCLIEGCGRLAISKGLCKNHYYQFKRGTVVYENGKYVKNG